jgi:2-polyprenyl-3-methyl-5-hydroxy-6-metoxy-1,4-benzoquinol methylase
MKMKIENKINEKDQWYVADQINCSASKSQKRTIAGRIEFILNTISMYAVKEPIILDAGCGDGVNLHILGGIEGAKVFGLDYNPLRVSRAKENWQNAFVTRGDLCSLCFKENSFDVILLNHVLEHIEEDVLVLKELHRILKPTGIFILGVPNEGCFIARLRNNVIQKSISRTTDHVHFYTEKEIRSKLESCGWKIKTVRRENFFMPHLMINSLMASYDIGFKILKLLGKVWKSQCSGLHFICEKSNANNRRVNCSPFV